MSISLKKKVRELTASDSGQGTDITGLKSDVKDIQDAIGDESTKGTILARIKALEGDS